MKKLIGLFVFLLLVGTQIVTAQSKQITGTVTSADDGLGMPGVSVVVKGTTIGASTDIDGKFSLEASASDVLVYSFVGMVSQEITVGSQSVINVVMETESIGMDEVIVVAYGTVKKSSFTGSVASVTSDKLERSQATDVAKALEGSIAGVTIINTSGQPGKDSKIRIRGLGSINASSEPLIIVDGAPYEGSLNSISNSDIASISVLKDAASSALYGARGANGVIVITLKKGEKGKTNITFDMKFGLNTRGVAEYDIMSNPSEYYKTSWEAMYNKGLNADKLSDADARTYASSKLYDNLGYNIYNVDNDKIVLENGEVNPNAAIKYEDSDFNDWEGKLYEPQVRQEYNLAISKGTEAGRVYFSVGYLNDKGFNANTDFTRYNSRIAFDSKVASWLDIRTSAQLTKTEANNSSTGGSYTNTFQWTRSIAPIYPFYMHDANGKIMKKNGNALYDYGNVLAGVNKGRAYGAKTNPLATQNIDVDEDSNYFVTQNTSFTITLPQDFTFSSNATFYGNWYQYNSFQSPVGGSGEAVNGSSMKYRDQTLTTNFNQILRWNKSLNGVSIQAMLGHETYTKDFNRLYGGKQNFVDPVNTSFSNAAKITDLNEFTREYRLEGYFAQVTTDYLSKYFLSASFRRDASSVFHPDNRWGTFWSVGGSWRLSEEDFLKDLDFIDNLKLKSSYGAQGNDNLYLPNTIERRSYSPYKTLYTVTSDGEDPGIKAKYLGNKEITWEKNLNFNVGLEFSIFNGLLTGDFDYFQRKTDDLLFNLPVPQSTGFTTQPRNIGNMVNKGWELSLTSALINQENIRLNVALNMTQFDNEITSLPEQYKEDGITRGSQIMKEGGSLYDFYMVKYAGVDPTNGDALYWQKDKDGVFVKTSGEDYTLTGNKQYVGTAIPDLRGGFSIALETYNFDFSTQFAFQLGGKARDTQYRGLMHSGQLGDNWHKDINKRWTPTNTITDVPRIEYNNRNQSKSSDRFLTDASYLSFKNVTLGYTFPKSLLSKVKIQSLRAYVMADNVALFSKRKGFDPRTSISGTESEAKYSPIRSFSVGLVVKL